MADWLVIILLSALAGFLCSRFLRGTIAWVASALVPWFKLSGIRAETHITVNLCHDAE